MKVLQLTKNYPPQFGGIESVTYDVTEGLNDAGIRCDVMCSNVTPATSIEDNGKYKIFRMGTLKHVAATSISPAIISNLRKLQHEYDVLQLHFPNPMVALAIYLVKPKTKIVVHWHSDIIRQRLVYPLFRPLETWVLKRADVIVATSQNYIEDSEPLKPFIDKTIAIPLGISTDRFNCIQGRAQQIKDVYGGRKIVFSLGRLVYYKGFEHLIMAAKHLDNDTVVLIGGGGELKKNLEQLIVENNLNDKVKLLGRIADEDLACYYEACDVFCLPSVKRSEAFGVVQLEAMYFGKPIVATEIPGSGVSWVNQHGMTGLNAPVNDDKALASKIRKILEDKVLAAEFSKNALMRFSEKFTREHMVKSFIDVYKELLLKTSRA